METEINLKELKGAPLSIIWFLLLKGNRTVTITELAEGTGYCEKVIRQGLKVMTEMQIVTKPQPNRYQLTGKNYQLPLYWDEKIEPVEQELPDGDLAGRVAQLEDSVKILLEKVTGLVEENSKKQIPYFLTDGGAEVEVYSRDVEECSNGLEECSISAGCCGPDVGTVTFGNSPRLEESSEDTEESSEETEESSNNILINNIQDNENKTDRLIDRPVNQSMEESIETIKLTGGKKVPEDAAKAWDGAMDQMAGQMDRGTFLTMQKNMKLFGYADGQFLVGAAGQNIRDWFELKGKATVERILSVMMDREIRITVQVCEPVPVPEKKRLPVVPQTAAEDEDETVRIIKDYMAHPIGCEFTRKELGAMYKMHPDPEVLRFILPRAANAEAAIQWMKLDVKQAKWKIMEFHAITGDMRKRLLEIDEVTPELIDYECQTAKKNGDRMGLAIYRIEHLQNVYQLPEEPIRTAYIPVM